MSPANKVKTHKSFSESMGRNCKAYVTFTGKTLADSHTIIYSVAFKVNSLKHVHFALTQLYTSKGESHSYHKTLICQ